MALPQIMCFAEPCISGGMLPSRSIPDLYSLPSVIPAGTGGGIIRAQIEPAPMFATSTESLDLYRVLALVIGIAIGAFALKRL